MIKFEENSYLLAFKENENLKDDKNIVNSVQESLQFKYGNVTRDKFDTKYSAEGWLGRKCIALPSAVWSGIAKVVYHLAKLIFIGIPKSFADKGRYLKIQAFCIARDFQESYGRLTSLFNDKYGQFHIQESQFQKAYYDHIRNYSSSSSNPSESKNNDSKDKANIIQRRIEPQTSSSINSLEDKNKDSKDKANIILEKFGSQLYDKLDKKFIGKILDSNSYSSIEKNMLSHTVTHIYHEQNLDSTNWVGEDISIAYLRWLAVKQPIFSTIPGKLYHQYEDTNLERDIGKLLSALPPKIDMGPRVYGHALEVHGNHRTAFVIDMNNKTVEYFNSFGDDAATKAPLTALATALSQKYGVSFNYHHRTANIHLQPDGYQCGIWTCKLIEERFKQGINFDPASLLDFDIAQYRNKVYAKAHKLYFFERVGITRYYTYLRQNIEGSSPQVLRQKEEKLDGRIRALLKNRSIIIESIFLEWGRHSEIPNLIKDLVQQTKAHI